MIEWTDDEIDELDAARADVQAAAVAIRAAVTPVERAAAIAAFTAAQARGAAALRATDHHDTPEIAELTQRAVAVAAVAAAEAVGLGEQRRLTAAWRARTYGRGDAVEQLAVDTLADLDERIAAMLDRPRS